MKFTLHHFKCTCQIYKTMSNRDSRVPTDVKEECVANVKKTNVRHATPRNENPK